ncbi:winged helix-turn-helix domain-containing protein [Methyloversatilis thermotolerans]|uniref:winged helix-turn-helix domain-containing protein n=1 Tax=Methyloversatilis thermotolerans TaxID=1346290 RepID=UPI00037594DB|nr:LysR family transcriptional regulator [Methyloversatilis thermotolerans]
MASDFQFRARFFSGDEVALGPGKVALLEAIARTGSISAAARDKGMSYRRAWQLVDTMNRCFRTPLVDTATGGRDGGGTRLTDAGEAVIEAYRSMEGAAERAAARHIRAIRSRLA